MIIHPKFSKFTWGALLLLAAALVIANQIGGFAEFRIGSLIIGIICLGVIVQSLVSLSFAVLPFPVGALYFVFRAPLGLPEIRFWGLLLAAVLASAGIAILMPNKLKLKRRKAYGIDEFKSDDEKNFGISVQFGGLSKYLHSECLETVNLECKFGGMDIYFNEAKLSPNGGKVHINCVCGGIDMFVPRDWRIIEDINTTLGGVDFDNKRFQPPPGAPELTVTGNVSLGGVEIKYI